MTQQRSSTLHAFLEQQTKAQLITLLEELAERHTVVHEALRDRCELATGDVARLVQTVRHDIAELSAESAWSNHWDDEGAMPDYSRVQERLQALLAQGHADEVVTLGEELLEAGTQQVEMSQDEGETAEQIAACMAVVFRALAQSSRSPVEQMLRDNGTRDMTKQFGYRCVYCKGTVDTQRVPREAFKHKAGFVILEDVVIGVCDVCGNRYYSVDTLKRVQALATGTLSPERIEQVPSNS